MTSLASLLAQLRDSEPLPHRVRLFDLAIAEALRMERALDEIVDNAREEARAAEHTQAGRRAALASREAAIALGLAAGQVARFPWHRVRRSVTATIPGAA